MTSPRVSESAGFCGRRIDYPVDIYHGFIDIKGRPVREYLLVDGVHLSRYGYEVWSNVVEQAIKR